MSIKFIVPGPIQPKQRPRKGKYGNFYTPPETEVFENKVALLATGAGLRRIEGDVKLTIACEITKGKDLDNAIKSVSDGLKVFFNDNQVVEIHAFKTVVKKQDERVVVIVDG